MTLPAYLWVALRSPFMIGYVKTRMRGQAYPAINEADFALVPLPLPPLAEQHRIVRKVTELTTLCDRLEAAQAEREARRDRVVAASFHRLADAPDDSQSDVRFSLAHLGRFTTRVDHIYELRKTILRLAVRGLIVPQNVAEGSAAHCLQLSDATRVATAITDRRADAKRQALLLADECWPVPFSWEWRGLADLALFIDYRGQTPTKAREGLRLITAKNVRKGSVSLVPEEVVTHDTYYSWMTRGLPKLGDVLFTTEAPMGNAAVVQLTENFALAQRVICLRQYGAIDPDFLVLQLLSAPFQLVLEKAATGLTAKGIKGAKLKRLPIAVPPVDEQRRIVAKVGELMTLCDQLQTTLGFEQDTRSRLLEAVLKQALDDATRKPATLRTVNS